MGLNDTPVSERTHIAFFGCRNAGKSSLLNAVTGQQTAMVSDVKGTTTDPVSKTMELLPAGPVVVIDTPGLDDEGTLGQMRMQAAWKVMEKTDVAVVVVDGTCGMRDVDREIVRRLTEKKIPTLVVWNKADRIAERQDDKRYVSAVTGEGIWALKEAIAELARENAHEKSIVGDLVQAEDFVVLVVPIDKAAPKGRLILPQQQVIRDLLEHGAVPVVVRDTELPGVMTRLGERVSMVITDSQVFGTVSKIVPEHIPLTSFSILFARYKGELTEQLHGIHAIDALQDGDTVLISEGCTHHRQCGDIGSVKIPAMLQKYTGKKLNIELTSGQTFPDNLDKYKVVIHCGGCMLSEKEMQSRIATARENRIPITNYGMVLALGSGILQRSMRALTKDGDGM